MYENQTYENIMTRLLAAVPDNLNKNEGSFIWDSLSPAALELAQAYLQLELVLQFGFAQTSYGQYLDYRAVEHGLTRKPAVKACGQVTITGANGTIVPAESLLASAAGVQFKTVTAVTIGESGQAAASIEAVNAGVGGNVPADAINSIPVSIPGVTEISNSQAISGGTDREVDEALLIRLLEKVRLPATSGNAAHYLLWAKEVPGIGDAKVLPLWDGPGTVKLIVIDSYKQPVSTEMVQTVAAYIEENRPVGVAVTVVSANTLNVNISVTLNLLEGHTLEGLQAPIEVALNEYLQEIAFQQDYVSYAQIGSIILNTPGVRDHCNLVLNSGISNLEVAQDEVAVMGTVTLI